jgi:hypothetical protein
MENGRKQAMHLPGRFCGLALALLVGCLSAGCISYGGLSVLEPMARSPEREAIMNEAVDLALAQVDLSGLAGKRVAVVVRAGSSAEPAWPAHLTAQLQRSIAAAGGTVSQDQPDIQMVANVDRATVQKRIRYVSFMPFFFADLVEWQSYWAEFSCAFEFKDASGAQALDPQAIPTVMTMPRKSNRLFTWGQLMY